MINVAWSCEHTLLKPLVKVGTDGIDMACADDFIHWIF